MSELVARGAIMDFGSFEVDGIEFAQWLSVGKYSVVAIDWERRQTLMMHRIIETSPPTTERREPSA